jgi:hypothetical protein
VRVAELRYPGVALAGLRPEDAHPLQTLLSVVEGHLADAAVALEMFQRAAAERPRRPFDEVGDFDTRCAVEHELRSQLPPDLPPEQRWAAEMDLRDGAEALLKRRAWEAGHLPAFYSHRIPFIHARTFVYALDGIIKALEQVAASPCAPAGASAALDGLKAAVPDVVHVRDSAHHVEDRARGKGRRERDLPKQPVHSHGIEAPGGGVVVMDMLHGNRLAYTVESGHLRDVEVSEATLAHAQRAVQETLDAFAWTGPPRSVP